MTKREKEILEIIKDNPFISQKDLSVQLGIERSSVAVHISSLQKKGFILGKGYIMREDGYIVVIGGSNVDILAKPHEKMSFKDSNPGKIDYSYGGVGRNIAEALSRFDISVDLMSAVGNDFYGNEIIDYTKAQGVSVKNVLIASEAQTSTYMAIHDSDGELITAISDMGIADRIDVKYLSKYKNFIERADMVAVDTNIPKEALEYLLNMYKGKVFVDTVSCKKTEKIMDLLDKIYCIKPNEKEIELLTGITIASKEDVENAARILHEKGIKKVFISLGSDGLYYSDSMSKGFLPIMDTVVNSTNGAGDALMAGLLVGEEEGLSLKEQAVYGMASSSINLESTDTISKQLSINKLRERAEEFKCYHNI